MAEFTKTPWKVEGDCYIIAGEPHKHSIIADIATANDDYEANAEHIIHCVNTHDKLVEALTVIKRDGLTNNTRYFMEKALSEAKGE